MLIHGSYNVKTPHSERDRLAARLLGVAARSLTDALDALSGFGVASTAN